MDNLEIRKGKITIFSTPDIFEQIEKYMLESGCNSMGFSAYKLVKLGLESLESTRWIKFSEQLPPEDKEYLVTNGKEILVAKYYCPDSWDIEQGYCNGSWIDSHDCSVTVTHWQELPTPALPGGDTNG